MEKQILTDPMTRPESTVLEHALGKNYKNFAEFARQVNEKNLVLEWNYYNDGKTWLCKILNKKKNTGWLSVWDTGFKLTVYSKVWFNTPWLAAAERKQRYEDLVLKQTV